MRVPRSLSAFLSRHAAAALALLARLLGFDRDNRVLVPVRVRSTRRR